VVDGGNRIRCWGYKGRGQLGNGNRALYLEPVHVAGSAFEPDASLLAYSDDESGEDGLPLPFTVLVSQPATGSSGALHLDAHLSGSISAPAWTCSATGGATCPDVGNSGALVADLALVAGSSLAFHLQATADVSAGAFAEVTAALDGGNAVHRVVVAVPIVPDGMYKGGFEAGGR
jgi:hypothetical protein